ncbi:MAG: 3-phosphoshikimate 1-carboxyvinyltransferase [Candidatus Lutacidiplasmatales archaeon]
MTTRIVRPGIVFGRLVAPPSKSYTHRAVLAAHFGSRPYRVENPLDCQDTVATLRGVGVLGTHSERREGVWELDRSDGRPQPRRRRIGCGESGTTLRFLLPAAARLAVPVTFAAAPSLRRRPVDGVLEVLRQAGVQVRRRPRATDWISVQGPMTPVRAPLDASESSQFLSGLLLALPGLSGPSELRCTGRMVSEPYVDATLRVLELHGIEVQRSGRRFRVPAPQAYRGDRIRVPGDASSAAYLWAAAAITGGTVDVEGMDEDWPQADLAILPWLESMGAIVARGPDSVRVSGRTTLPLRANVDDAPDLLPLLGVLAASTPGRSILSGGIHARRKESDRRAETVRLVRAMGARITVTSQAMRIEGRLHPRGFAYGGAADHRMVMSAAVGALAATGPSQIGSADAVTKSFPGFWDAMARLGVALEKRR